MKNINVCYVLKKVQPLVGLVVFLVTSCFATVSVYSQDYTVTNLSLGGSRNFVNKNGINDFGHVTGWSSTESGEFRAFLFDGTDLHNLGNLGGNNGSQPGGINNLGHVVGVSGIAGGSNDRHAFLYDGETMHDLGAFEGVTAWAVDINDSGQVAVWSWDRVKNRSFLYDGNTTHDLGSLGGNSTTVVGINNSGQLFGNSKIADGSSHAFLYDGTTMHNLGTLVEEESTQIIVPSDGSASVLSGFNDLGQVIGRYHTTFGLHAFFYDGTTMYGIKGLGVNGTYPNSVTPMDINESGQVAGMSFTQQNELHVVMYEGGVTHDLGTLGGNYAQAFSINDSGHIVGSSRYSENSDLHAFLYDGTTMVDLNDYITSTAPADMVLHEGVAISNNGSIVARSNAGYVLLTLSESSAAPTVGPISLDNNPVAVGTVVLAEASFLDEDAADTHTANWVWGDGSTDSGVVLETERKISGSHTFSEAGIYSINLSVTDSTNLTSTVSREIVVYDSSAGFVTGGGWFFSPPGAFKEDIFIAGRAMFNFVSNYKKGASVPTGKTQFQFRTANLSFHSDNYEWLVVGGARAQYKGTGYINNDGIDYKFMLTAVDGDVNGGGGTDRFRIKIWYYDADNDADVIVYDNQIDADAEGTLEEGTSLGGGVIVIHS